MVATARDSSPRKPTSTAIPEVGRIARHGLREPGNRTRVEQRGELRGRNREHDGPCADDARVGLDARHATVLDGEPADVSAGLDLTAARVDILLQRVGDGVPAADGVHGRRAGRLRMARNSRMKCAADSRAGSTSNVNTCAVSSRNARRVGSSPTLRSSHSPRGTYHRLSSRARIIAIIAPVSCHFAPGSGAGLEQCGRGGRHRV